MIVTFLEDDILPDNRTPVKLDIIVRPEQRIEDVYRRLLENGFFTKVCQRSQIRVYSVRQRAYVNPLLTFVQGGIYAGDILAVEISAV